MDERFKEEWTSSVNNVCSRQPSTITRVEVIEQIDQHIQDNQRIRTDETASEISISHGFAYNKVCTRCIPKQMTEVHKNTHLEVSRNHLK